MIETGRSIITSSGFLRRFSHGAIYCDMRVQITGKEGARYMPHYLILCRSLTYAQRTAAALERAGIKSRTIRSPKSISGEGCSHSVKIAEIDLSDALSVLYNAGLRPKHIFVSKEGGEYGEVMV